MKPSSGKQERTDGPGGGGAVHSRRGLKSFQYRLGRADGFRKKKREKREHDVPMARQPSMAIQCSHDDIAYYQQGAMGERLTYIMADCSAVSGGPRVLFLQSSQHLRRVTGLHRAAADRLEPRLAINLHGHWRSHGQDEAGALRKSQAAAYVTLDLAKVHHALDTDHFQHSVVQRCRLELVVAIRSPRVTPGHPAADVQDNDAFHTAGHLDQLTVHFD
eukprot:scpid26827/ scgid24477/ 